MTQTDATSYGDDDGREQVGDDVVTDPAFDDLGTDDLEADDRGTGDRRTDDAGPDDRSDDLRTGDPDDGPEEGNRVLAPVANAVLGHIARSIVDDPDAVEVDTIPLRAGKVRLAVRVAPNDFGRLIGRRGRVAAAVRTLVSAAAVRDGLDVEVEFVE